MPKPADYSALESISADEISDPDCHFYPASRGWAPWNLECSIIVYVADDADI